MLTTDALTEIIRVVTDEHAQDVGRWQAECHSNSPLGLALVKYMNSQFMLLSDLRGWIEDGRIPE